MLTPPRSSDLTAVYLEIGQKRVFACALGWPGWCRSGKTEEQALEALARYAERYATVAREAGISFDLQPRNDFKIVERLAGSAGYTDFGVPGLCASSDLLPWPPEAAEHHIALLRASWVVFKRVIATAPAELRKGPRGGGRDRDKMIDHVLGAEAVYGRKIGVALRQPSRDDPSAIAALRDAMIRALQAPDAWARLPETGWPPPYAVRRIAWHVLDHTWEIEDRSVAAV